MTATSAASVAAIFLFSATLAVAAPSSAIASRLNEQRTAAGLGNIALLESGEHNSLEDGRFVGLTHAGSSEDEEEPELVEEDGGMTGSVFEERKRPWGKNNMALWGKRGSSSAVADEESIDKRKWGQKNMALWGKRSEDNYRFPVGRYPIVTAAEKRKWGQKNMALWGR